MFLRKDVKPFAKKVWLASPTMHGDELKWMHKTVQNDLLKRKKRNDYLRLHDYTCGVN